MTLLGTSYFPLTFNKCLGYCSSLQQIFFCLSEHRLKAMFRHRNSENGVISWKRNQVKNSPTGKLYVIAGIDPLRKAILVGPLKTMPKSHWPSPSALGKETNHKPCQKQAMARAKNTCIFHAACKGWFFSCLKVSKLECLNKSRIVCFFTSSQTEIMALFKMLAYFLLACWKFFFHRSIRVSLVKLAFHFLNYQFFLGEPKIPKVGFVQMKTALNWNKTQILTMEEMK